MGCKECKGEIITVNTSPLFSAIHKFQPVPINRCALRIDKVYKNQQYPKNKTKFTDEIFPPNNNSIFGLDANNKKIDTFTQRTSHYESLFSINPNDIIWLNASEIFNGESYEIFQDSVTVDDITQGTLADCYFLSSICAMSRYPQLIYQIFRTWKIPKNGCYEVVLRLNGEWKIVLLDDKFPCDRKTRKPIFSKPHHNELWSMLLEKAWAKVNKGYINIIGGMINEVLLALTPFNVFSYYNDTIFGLNEIDLWTIIKDSFDNNYILTATTVNQKAIEQTGLLKSHAYTLLQYKEGLLGGRVIKLIQVRNPWGYKEWTGDFCDGSPLWTEQLKETLDISTEEKEDGMFWMDFNDFYKLFRLTAICQVTSPNYSVAITISKERIDYPNVYELYIYEDTHVNIAVIKKSYRFNRKIPPDAKLSINLILLKKDGIDLIIVDTNSSAASNPNIEQILPHGYYLIYVHAIMESSTFDKKRKIKLLISANDYFNTRFIGIDNNFALIKHIITDYLRKNIVTKQDTLFQIEQSNFFNTTYGFSYLYNQREDKEIKVEVKAKLDNFKLFTKIESNFTLGMNSDWLCLGTKIEYLKEETFSMTFILGVEEHNEMNKKARRKDDIRKYFEDIRYSFPAVNNFNFIFKKINFDMKNYPMLFEGKSLSLFLNKNE